MNSSAAPDYSDLSMFELFRLEAETQLQSLTQALLALEREPAAAGPTEEAMRAAHSLKGAARMIGLECGVRVAHAMEDCLSAAQHGTRRIGPPDVDLLLKGVDLLTRMAQTPEDQVPAWAEQHAVEIEQLVDALNRPCAAARAPAQAPTCPAPARAASAPPESSPQVRQPVTETSAASADTHTKDSPLVPDREASNSARQSAHQEGNASEPDIEETAASSATPAPAPSHKPSAQAGATVRSDSTERVLRISAERLNRLLGLAGENLVESRWLEPFSAGLMQLKRAQWQAERQLDRLREQLLESAPDAPWHSALAQVHETLQSCRQMLVERLDELDHFERRTARLAQRLYDVALDCRMRPLQDAVHAFPRLVRDLARQLGKQVRFDILGANTPVDRDLLETIETCLGHLLRNALDHGIETPQERCAAGKPEQAQLVLKASHRGGRLVLRLADDGRGIDLEAIRAAVVERGHAPASTAACLGREELIEFLFLPGFSLRKTVTDLSGRGVGLDAVRSLVRSVGGHLRVETEPGAGTQFQLELPLSLSVRRALLVEVAGEAYAFPLAQIGRTLKVPREQIETIEGRPHFAFEDKPVGLVSVRQLLGYPSGQGLPDPVPVVLLAVSQGWYALAVDRFLGQRELVVHPLDPRLGKIRDVAAGALMEDGSPLLILDVEDLTRSIEKRLAEGRLIRLPQKEAGAAASRRKRILVVDDSLTIRELERKLLEHHGYAVETAVDGLDGWNALRNKTFDLVVTDVDMPRMDGIALVEAIKSQERLRSLPVMIVSYKDREEDRRRGLQAGADYYLTKGSFHDEQLITAVMDLIGEAKA